MLWCWQKILILAQKKYLSNLHFWSETPVMQISWRQNVHDISLPYAGELSLRHCCGGGGGAGGGLPNLPPDSLAVVCIRRACDSTGHLVQYAWLTPSRYLSYSLVRVHAPYCTVVKWRFFQRMCGTCFYLDQLISYANSTRQIHRKLQVDSRLMKPLLNKSFWH